MKYIRTKDGRITTLKDELIDNVDLWVSGGKENILKIADTIEELCDELVFYDLEEECMQILSPSFGKWSILNDLKDGRIKDNNVYGAIWTDKGLIYVAKMNDKGELELL